MKRHPERRVEDDRALPAGKFSCGKKPAFSGRCLPRGDERARHASARLLAATAHDCASALQLSATWQRRRYWQSCLSARLSSYEFAVSQKLMKSRSLGTVRPNAFKTLGREWHEQSMSCDSNTRTIPTLKGSITSYVISRISFYGRNPQSPRRFSGRCQLADITPFGDQNPNIKRRECFLALARRQVVQDFSKWPGVGDCRNCLPAFSGRPRISPDVQC
ncbi:hypothetical protein HDK64DRAFT_117987 [Phyllosticta capitalensis]